MLMAGIVGYLVRTALSFQEYRLMAAAHWPALSVVILSVTVLYVMGADKRIISFDKALHLSALALRVQTMSAIKPSN